MAAPTSITVEVDRTEYARQEPGRNIVLVTIAVEGSSLSGEQIQVQLIKARYNRDVVVTSKLVTLTTNGPHFVQVSWDLCEIIDEKAVPKVRRGKYFVRATSVANPLVTADSANFRVSLITVEALKASFLHGAILSSAEVLFVVNQPQFITGVHIDEVSFGHPKGAHTLAYNYVIDQAPEVLGVTTEPFALVDGQTLVLRLNGGPALTATFNTAEFAAIGAATAAEVAAVINAEIPGVIASDDGTGKVKIVGDLVAGTRSIFVDSSGTATTTLGLLNQSSTANVVRTLSWCGGPTQTIEAGVKTYILRRGTTAAYIKVRISSIAELPSQSHAEIIIVDRKPLDDAAIQGIIDQAISWVEDVAISVFLEPTRIVTEIDPDAIVFPPDESTPILVGADWDKVVDALTYTTPSAGHWINFRCPYYPLICFEELYGKLSNTRIVDVALEWIEAHEKTGFVELVPFNQEVAFNFIGLMWVESLRGPVPLPNFWNFTALVGFRKTPAVLIELAMKKAIMDLLTIAGQAYRGGIASTALSRDGVSESVSFTAAGMWGIYSAAIENYRKWIESELIRIRGAFRGPNMVVL